MLYFHLIETKDFFNWILTKHLANYGLYKTLHSFIRISKLYEIHTLVINIAVAEGVTFKIYI